ncbi:Serine/threonine-protein kinase TAO1 [Manis javanica]|nr:Serine/threonine-protein kinase TAO1 [Manis javanica]
MADAGTHAPNQALCAHAAHPGGEASERPAPLPRPRSWPRPAHRRLGGPATPGQEVGRGRGAPRGAWSARGGAPQSHGRGGKSLAPEHRLPPAAILHPERAAAGRVGRPRAACRAGSAETQLSGPAAVGKPWPADGGRATPRPLRFRASRARLAGAPAGSQCDSPTLGQS